MSRSESTVMKGEKGAATGFPLQTQESFPSSLMREKTGATHEHRAQNLPDHHNNQPADPQCISTQP